MHFSNMVTIFRLPSMYFVYLAYVLVIYDELSPNNEMSVDCFVDQVNALLQKYMQLIFVNFHFEICTTQCHLIDYWFRYTIIG